MLVIATKAVTGSVTGSVTGAVSTARNVITREINARSPVHSHTKLAREINTRSRIYRDRRAHTYDTTVTGARSTDYAKRARSASPITISREGAPGVGHINVTLATRIEHERRQADMRAHHDAPRASKALELSPWRPRFTLTTWMFDRKETAMEVFAEEMRERKASGKFDSQALLASIEAVESSDEDDGAGESSALSDDDE